MSIKFSKEWTEMRNQARQLENEVETKLVAFSKLGKDANRENYGVGGGANVSEGRYEGMSMELEQLLGRLSEVNNNMHEFVGDKITPTLRHTLSRHTEILNDMKRDFVKTKSSIRETRDKAQLLSSVQRDINTYRSSEAERQDQYLRENQSIHNSMRGAEDAISIAISAKEALVSQRGIVGQATTRLGQVLQKFPAVNNVMKKISHRKNRDQIIMAGVISSCIIFLFWYTMH
eukprot:m.110010 g.110010  ORF g.110010 m.110010 type:complete len:232 (-) comp16968_c0_seq1:438-1133(-)